MSGDSEVLSLTFLVVVLFTIVVWMVLHIGSIRDQVDRLLAVCEKGAGSREFLDEKNSDLTAKLQEARDELELERKNRDATNVMCDSLESRVSVMQIVMQMSYDERKRFLEQFGEVAK